MAKFQKLFNGFAPVSSGGKCLRKLELSLQATPEAGLYDANDNLLASWDELIYIYDMQTAKSSPSVGHTTADTVFSENINLSAGTKLVIDASIGDFPNPIISIDDFIGTIDHHMFAYCDNLTSVVIAEGVKAIYSNAFLRCNNLTSVTIPASVTTIGAQAFCVLGAITDVYYSGTEEQWNAIDINNNNGGNAPLLNATIHYNYTG